MEKQLKQFLNFLQNEKRVSDNTLQSYRRDLTQFKEYLDSNDKKYKKMQEKDIQEYLEYLEAQGKKPSTILRTIASIRSFYQYELKNGMVSGDPTEKVKSPKVEKKAPCILTSKEVELLLEQPQCIDLKGIRDKAMLEFAYATGMRVTEIISLNIDDVNLEEGYVTCKTGNKQRTIPLGTMSLRAVKEYINDGIYAIRIENALFVKRLQYMPGKLLVKSDNPIYQPFEVDLKTDSVNIIGAVVYVMNDMSCI